MTSLNTENIKVNRALDNVIWSTYAKNKTKKRFRLPFSKKKINAEIEISGNEHVVNLYCNAVSHSGDFNSDAAGRQRQLLMFLAGNLPPVELLLDTTSGYFLNSNEMCTQLKSLLEKSHRLDTADSHFLYILPIRAKYKLLFKEIKNTILLHGFKFANLLLNLIAFVVLVAIILTMYYLRDKIGYLKDISGKIFTSLQSAFEYIDKWIVGNSDTTQYKGRDLSFLKGNLTGVGLGVALVKMKDVFDNSESIKTLGNIVKYFVAKDYVQRRIEFYNKDLNHGMSQELQDNMQRNSKTIETLVDIPCNNMSYTSLYSELKKKKSWFGFGSDGDSDKIRKYLLNTIFDNDANVKREYLSDEENHILFRKELFVLCGMNNSFKLKSTSPLSLFHFVNSYGGMRSPDEIAKAFIIIADNRVNSNISKVAVKEAIRDSIKIRTKKHKRRMRGVRKSPHT